MRPRDRGVRYSTQPYSNGTQFDRRCVVSAGHRKLPLPSSSLQDALRSSVFDPRCFGSSVDRLSQVVCRCPDRSRLRLR
jgi:hypothetical protein